VCSPVEIAKFIIFNNYIYIVPECQKRMTFFVSISTSKEFLNM